MKYAGGPNVEVDILITAPIKRVWELVSDIDRPARFSSEFLGARWIDSEPGVGARFAGRNHHDAIGEWETLSFVTRYERPDRSPGPSPILTTRLPVAAPTPILSVTAEARRAA